MTARDDENTLPSRHVATQNVATPACGDRNPGMWRPRRVASPAIISVRPRPEWSRTDGTVDITSFWSLLPSSVSVWFSKKLVFINSRNSQNHSLKILSLTRSISTLPGLAGSFRALHSLTLFVADPNESHYYRACSDTVSRRWWYFVYGRRRLQSCK